jgi:hypothetical protein
LADPPNHRHDLLCRPLLRPVLKFQVRGNQVAVMLAPFPSPIPCTLNPDCSGECRGTQRVPGMEEPATVVLSGLKFERSTDSVPGLSRLPILGRLFVSPGPEGRGEPLIVVLTPEVISTE